MWVLDILEAASIMSLTFTHSRGSTEASTAGPILTSGQLFLRFPIPHLGPDLISIYDADSGFSCVGLLPWFLTPTGFLFLDCMNLRGQ